MMKKGKLSKIFVFMFFFTGTFAFTKNAKAAGWVMPANVFNLIGDFDQAILNLTNWLLGFAAMAAVVALIWAGMNYIFSSGDTQKADLSKRIFYYAMIGLFVVGIAYALIRAITTQILF